MRDWYLRPGTTSLLLTAMLLAAVITNTTEAVDRDDGLNADYVRYCASCHGLSGTGDGPVADQLKIRPADLTRLTQRYGGEFPFEHVRRVIDGRPHPQAPIRAHGPVEMPVWGHRFESESASKHIAQQRIDRLTRYIQRLQR